MADIYTFKMMVRDLTNKKTMAEKYLWMRTQYNWRKEIEKNPWVTKLPFNEREEKLHKLADELLQIPSIVARLDKKYVLRMPPDGVLIESMSDFVKMNPDVKITYEQIKQEIDQTSEDFKKDVAKAIENAPDEFIDCFCDNYCWNCCGTSYENILRLREIEIREDNGEFITRDEDIAMRNGHNSIFKNGENEYVAFNNSGNRYSDSLAKDRWEGCGSVHGELYDDRNKTEKNNHEAEKAEVNENEN